MVNGARKSAIKLQLSRARTRQEPAQEQRHEKIRKAVFPVAGLGTRFLPATKAVPKEMLTVIDRPVIQWVVDEAREAGIEHFIFVTGRNKGVIEDHFDRQFELEETLRRRGKTQALEMLERDLPQAASRSKRSSMAGRLAFSTQGMRIALSMP